MAINGNNLYVAQDDGNKISKIDITANPIVKTDVVGGLNSPSSLLIKDYELYISEYNGDKISKYKLPCSNTTDVVTKCKSYKWIDGITYTSSNNVAQWTLTDSEGCDSLITLDLTINNVSDISTSLSGTTISANNTGAFYRWLDCDNSNAIINSETSQSYTTTANGNFAVELTEGGCTDTSDCVAITTVGVLENSFGDLLSVYPNPTKGNFSIDLGSVYNNVSALITDINGKLIYSKSISHSQIINLSIKEPAGIYMVSIQVGEKRTVIRLIKE